LTQVAIAIGLLWSGTFQELLDYTAVGLAAITGLTVASIFPIRLREGMPRPYKMPLYPLPPVLFLLLIFWTIAYTLHSELFKNGELQRPGPATYSILTLLVGIPLAYLIPARRPGPAA
jgi:APA family basic amino acid/polyamine antiporter